MNINVASIEEYIKLFKEGHRLSTLILTKEIERPLFDYVNLHKNEDEDCMYLYGYCYGRGYGVAENNEKAFEIYLNLANKKNPIAQCKIGWCYENGKGVEIDYLKAVEWYRRAAVNNNARAQCNLAWCYKVGRGVSQDIEKSIEWFEKSAAQNQFMALWNLGWYYEHGYEGVVEQSYSKAIDYYKKSADQDCDLAQWSLGQIYENVEKDTFRAIQWYEKSANQNYVRAQYNLGQIYEKGKNVEKDLSKVMKLYEKAANQNYARAQYSLGKLYELGDGVSKNVLKAKELYEKAANQGFEQAQYSLGRLYETGQGVLKDLAKAKEYYEEAVALGDVDAEEALKSVKKQLAKEKLHNSDCKDVFISWNHYNKGIKDEIVHFLEISESRFFPTYSFWESDQDGKGELDECIRNAIDEAHSYIIILTGNSIKSPWVKMEVDRILQKVEPILNCEPILPSNSNPDEAYKLCIKIILIETFIDETGNESYCNVIEKIEESKDNTFSRLLKYAWIFGKTDLQKLANSLVDAIEWSLLLEYKQNLTKRFCTFPTALTKVVRSYDSDSGLIPASLKFDEGYLDRPLYQGNMTKSIEEILKLQNHILIYGEGGIGKTLFLQNFARNYFDKNNYLFYISSDDIKSNIANDIDLLGFLKKYCFDILFNPADAAKVKKESFEKIINRQNKIYILVDGLDEIESNSKRVFLQKVESFLNSHLKYGGRIYFIFSSRTDERGFISQFIKEKSIELYELRRIEDKDIEKIYENMAKKIKFERCDPRLLEDYSKETFINRLSNISDDVKNNPLLLTNLIFIFLTTKNILTKKYNIIDESVSILIKDLENERNASFEYQEYIQGKNLYRMLGHISISQAYGNTQHIEELIEDYINNLKISGDSYIIANSISDFLQRRAIIIDNHISHKMFNNYFAAKYIFHDVYRYDYSGNLIKTLKFNDNGKKFKAFIVNWFSKEEETWVNITCDFLLKVDNEINALGSKDSDPSFITFEKTLHRMISKEKISPLALEVIFEMSRNNVFYYSDIVKCHYKRKGKKSHKQIKIGRKKKIV